MKWREILSLSVQKERMSEWAEAHPIRLAAIGSIVGAGVLQELTNHLVDSEVLPWLGGSWALPHWVLVLLLSICLTSGYAAWRSSAQSGRLQALSKEQSPTAVHKRLKDAEGQRILFGGYLATSLDVLDGIVASLQHVTWPEGDRNRVKRLLIQIILKRIQTMYPPNVVPYVSLYLPGEDSDYLRIFENINVHPDRVNRNKWYIGSDKAKQRKESGTAGWVYLKQEPKVHHINARTHKAEEGKDYVPSRKPGDVALYYSFVAFPIVDGSSSLAVLCLDSSQHDTFDGDPRQAELEPAARLLVSILKL